MNAAYRLLGWGTMPVGAALGGAVAEAVGLRATFLAASLVGAAVLVGSVVVTDEAIAAAEGSGGATVG